MYKKKKKKKKIAQTKLFVSGQVHWHYENLPMQYTKIFSTGRRFTKARINISNAQIFL